ncbi:fermentation/respiration switch protein [Actinomadura madurae]|nr:fermentation/respiration switch protein [Actinomadura madurae]
MRHHVRLSAAASVTAMTLAVAGCGGTETPATEGGADPSARASGTAAPAESIKINEEEWFREIRLEDWAENGGETAAMQGVLQRIQKATGKKENPQRFDTVVDPGPGNWLTEWSTIGKKAMTKADAARSSGDADVALNQYHAASTYFTAAAYPQHRESEQEEKAYEMAKAAYEKAARLKGWRFERLQVPLEGGTFEAFLHLPKGVGPFPVVLSTGGIDRAKTVHWPLFEKYLAPAGVAMVSFDNAGFGDSKDYPADRPDMDRLYSAVVDTLLEDKHIDAKRVAAVATSYGANAVARSAFTDERVRAVVAICSPVHEALNAGAEFIDELTPQPRAALAARFNVPVENTKRMGQIIKKTSLVNQGLVGKKRTDTPILAMTTPDDPFAPIEDLKRLAAASTDGEVKITGGHGHCPTVKERDRWTWGWLKRHL